MNKIFPKTVLITGASGYLGNLVLQKLQLDLAEGRIENLVACDLKPPTIALEGVQYEQFDLLQPEDLRAVFQKHQPKVVLHLAAVIDSQSMSRELQFRIDVEGTRHIVEACLSVGTQRLLISSSGAAYGYHADNPTWLREEDALRGNEVFAYSDHKRLVEELLKDYRVKHPELEQLIFRIGTILGSNTNNLITNLFRKSWVLGLKGFDSPFVFIWDEDAAECFRQGVFSEKVGIYNLAGDGAVRNKDLALLMHKRYKAYSPFFLRTMLRFFKTLGTSPYGPEQLLFLQYRPVLDNQKLKEEFGFTPQKTSLEVFGHYLEAQGRRVNLSQVSPMMPSVDN